jgi:hypothetical protein
MITKHIYSVSPYVGSANFTRTEKTERLKHHDGTNYPSAKEVPGSGKRLLMALY